MTRFNMETVMTGVSVRGKNHAVNQDAFLAYAANETAILAVSDGLGSLAHSGEGAEAVCDILRAMVCADVLPYDDMEEIPRMVQVGWTELLKKRNVPVAEAGATCLFCVLRQNTAYIFRLGDGFIGIRADNETRVFFDAKADGFLNETYCLQDFYVPQEWEKARWEYDNLAGVLLCSDGIDVDCKGMSQAESLRTFTEEFLQAYKTCSAEESAENIFKWLSDWKSSDDKTLTYMIKGV